ncbi:MAG: S-adenosylmethionine decarboxylase [Nanoarchaeota archaeon]|nr:S-adenosylmethionine decarboxylase [Nanoarchaeota archaeon]MBU1631902.1 S-adenosylmethionine decarboxylase [Nanoarchaeota archaeon]MBU1876611.1 S-adenosylmethionine decarboxylase [Nanoarchaeota archaeon]
MTKNYHQIFEVSDCNSSQYDSNLIDKFLRGISRLMASRIIQNPVVAKREYGYVGFTGFIITESSHVVIHTFTALKEAVIEIYSYNYFDNNIILNHITECLNVRRGSIMIKNVNDIGKIEKSDNFIECEEPNCIRKSTKVWGGRKVCQDHYEQYRDKYEKNIYSMNEFG